MIKLDKLYTGFYPPGE